MFFERWLPAPGYEKSHLISDHGRIQSIDRMILTIDGRTYGHTGKMLKTRPNHHGYPTVTLSLDGKWKPVHIHTLVAAAFVGARPEGLDCLHRDDIKTNNHWSNLYYGTPSQNRHDSVRNGTHFNANKTHCKRKHRLSGHNIIRTKGKPNVRTCRTCVNDQRRAKRQAA